MLLLYRSGRVRQHLQEGFNVVSVHVVMFYQDQEPHQQVAHIAIDQVS